MELIGYLSSRPSAAIRNSAVGAGFECLDRKMWKDTDDVYRFAAESGIKYARLQTGWARTETVKGIYDWSWLDRSVDLLRAGGIEPWLSLSYGNGLYMDVPAPDATGCHPLVSETAWTGWSRYVSALLEHFRGRVRYFEIWNEPDNGGFWYPHPCNMQEYAELVRRTSEIIRKIRPDAVVIGGALTYGPTVTGLDNIRILLENGFAECIDVLTFHHYATTIERQSPEHLEIIRRMFARYGKKDLPIWMGEGGFPSQLSKTQALNGIPVDEQLQASMLVRYMVNDFRMGIAMSSYFCFSDFTCYHLRGKCSEPNYFGVLTNDPVPRRKLSYYVLSRMASLFDDRTSLCKDAMAELYSTEEHAEELRYRFAVQSIGSPVTVFRRGDAPFVSYHLVTDMIGGDFCHDEVNMDLYLPDLEFNSPVVANPMTGEVFGNAQYVREGKIWHFRNLPRLSTPLFLTDRTAIELQKDTIEKGC